MSSERSEARRKLRECDGLVDALIYIVQSEIGQKDSDSKVPQYTWRALPLSTSSSSALLFWVAEAGFIPRQMKGGRGGIFTREGIWSSQTSLGKPSPGSCLSTISAWEEVAYMVCDLFDQEASGTQPAVYSRNVCPPAGVWWCHSPPCWCPPGSGLPGLP